MIASQLLAGDLLHRGVLVAPFSFSLPGACYYLMTLQDVAQRPDIAALRRWIVAQLQPGDAGVAS